MGGRRVGRLQMAVIYLVCKALWGLCSETIFSIACFVCVFVFRSTTSPLIRISTRSTLRSAVWVSRRSGTSRRSWDSRYGQVRYDCHVNVMWLSHDWCYSPCFQPDQNLQRMEQAVEFFFSCSYTSFYREL